MEKQAHLSPETLLMAVDGELPAKEQARVEAHLAACWECRRRKQELEGAIGRFVDFHRESFEQRLPAQEGPRALFSAQLREAKKEVRLPLLRERLAMRLAWGALTIALLGLLWQARRQDLGTRPMLAAHSGEFTPGSPLMPDHALTPGATIALDRMEVCQNASVNNRRVPEKLEREVFAEYGISPAHPEAYEVDYLITPALGGAEDIHNLWPESNQKAEWNARVKDALEERLRDLVCEGRVDLATAQHEIAHNWIDAYKKYFRTDRPLADAR